MNKLSETILSGTSECFAAQKYAISRVRFFGHKNKEKPSNGDNFAVYDFVNLSLTIFASDGPITVWA
jgi:hypothetical protein